MPRGRQPIGERAMTAAERQQKHRDKQRDKLWEETRDRVHPLLADPAVAEFTRWLVDNVEPADLSLLLFNVQRRVERALAA
jgi:hypothetical protein